MMKKAFVSATLLLTLSGFMTLATAANLSFDDRGTYLSDIKRPADAGNIHVHRLSSDKHSSDFVVFVKEQVPLHKHLKHTETVFVLEGEGLFTLGDKEIKIGPGHYVKIPEGTPHAVKVTSKTPMKVLSVQAPEFFGKDRVPVERP